MWFKYKELSVNILECKFNPCETKSFWIKFNQSIFKFIKCGVVREMAMNDWCMVCLNKCDFPHETLCNFEFLESESSCEHQLMECFQQIYDELHSMPENQYNKNEEKICIENSVDDLSIKANKNKCIQSHTDTQTHLCIRMTSANVDLDLLK